MTTVAFAPRKRFLAEAFGPRTTTALPPRELARRATRALWDELALFPKPGLVSLRDPGSHSDMDASTFVRSLFALRPYFHSIFAAGAVGEPFAVLRDLGLRAEAAMLNATGGVNTHRGAIFALGLLGAAAALSIVRRGDVSDDALRDALKTWDTELRGPVTRPSQLSNGMRAAERYGVPGARGEAAAGFPSVFEVAIPALRDARRRGIDARRARLSAFFALLERVPDTNVLHRGGRDGLDYVRHSAAAFHAAGGVHAPDAIERAEQVHRRFVARRLSPGGCADLLASALFIDSVQTAR